MVAWNSREAGVRLDESTGVAAFSCWCTACGTWGRDLPLGEALARCGPAIRARDLARRLRCVRCGARQAEIRVITDTLNWRRSADWQPDRQNAPLGPPGRRRQA